MPGRIYVHEIQVSFGDVDYARILYYPRLFHYCHVVMEGFFDSVVGMPYAKVLSERKLGFPTVHTEADYHDPMPYGLRLSIGLSVRAVGTTSLSLRYQVRAVGEDEPRAEARTTVVCVDMDRFTKLPIPRDLRDAFSDFLEL